MKSGNNSLIGAAEEIIGGNAVVIAEQKQVVDGQLVGAALIAGVHRLRCAEYGGDFLLCFVMILAQITHPLEIGKIQRPHPLYMICHIV